MVLIHKRLIALSVFIAIIGVGLIVAAFATDNWIHSTPRANETMRRNNSSGTASGFTANVTFGLFTGYKSIDFGIGPRSYNLIIKCQPNSGACAYISIDKDSTTDSLFSNILQQFKNQSGQPMEDFGLFCFSLYVATLVMLVLAIVWGLVSIGFAVFNVFGRPIETVTGPSGLYLWNSLAMLFSLAAIGCYLALYLTQLKMNILTLQDQLTFTSKDQTFLDMSFYFVVGAAGAFFLNIFILCLSGQKCSCDYYHSSEKEVDSGMILY
ncbi:clarin-3 [Biomphalaria glabrata]|uniref:Clarin-3-like n=1 Tax=Biomphalaria glabrata TaxID=6526 RepID=A0A2C9M7U7_BIOGL|nr:clarin-3-like [Biomphalaria glabrata]XP_013060814.1 clarin-3-like [Biomphalaria glabrata]XP_013060815.1 clarin-3-like [Biomphalaria glabrata]KAI8769647.1 clarin-3-like [Biomphalaria glabrata]KAI8789987.1 clarin-3 [Biomphalaria glabrata]